MNDRLEVDYWDGMPLLQSFRDFKRLNFPPLVFHFVVKLNGARL